MRRPAPPACIICGEPNQTCTSVEKKQMRVRVVVLNAQEAAQQAAKTSGDAPTSSPPAPATETTFTTKTYQRKVDGRKKPGPARAG
jgi:hypothetical protein